MVNKIYYFVVPNSVEHDMQIIMGKVFTCPLKSSDIESICFNKRYKREDCFYTFLPQYKIEIIINKFKALKVLFAYKNITEEVLMGVQNNNTNFVKTFTNITHKQLLNVFLKANQTIIIF
jgi:hypothetical protein